MKLTAKQNAQPTVGMLATKPKNGVSKIFDTPFFMPYTYKITRDSNK